jgi:hypothetical protein
MDAALLHACCRKYVNSSRVGFAVTAFIVVVVLSVNLPIVIDCSAFPPTTQFSVSKEREKSVKKNHENQNKALANQKKGKDSLDQSEKLKHSGVKW